LIGVIVENRYPFEEVKAIAERHVKFIPGLQTIMLNNHDVSSMQDYNKLLTSLAFWEPLPERVLIFQHDSGILREGIEEFMEWDYVGAPWKFQERGGNGGLSLRTRDQMIACINAHPYNESEHGNEDVYFSNFVGRVAPRDVCSKFSVETIFQLGTFGYHQIEAYHGEAEVNQIMTQYEGVTTGDKD